MSTTMILVCSPPLCMPMAPVFCHCSSEDAHESQATNYNRETTIVPSVLNPGASASILHMHMQDELADARTWDNSLN